MMDMYTTMKSDDDFFFWECPKECRLFCRFQYESLDDDDFHKESEQCPEPLLEYRP